MPDREKVAKDLADIGAWIAGRVGFEMARNFMRTIDDAVALIKEQEDLGTELTNAMELIHKKNKRIEKLLKEQEHKDKMFHALEEDWKRLKEQDAVKPKYNARTNWYECGNCHYSMTSGMHCRSELIPAYKVGFCAKCGKAVMWG